jgi:excisionase family DNA binding protein
MSIIIVHLIIIVLIVSVKNNFSSFSVIFLGGEIMRKIVADWSDVPVIIDLPFAARLLGLSVECLKKKAQSQQLPGAIKIGKVWRIDKSALKSYIETGERRNL